MDGNNNTDIIDDDGLEQLRSTSVRLTDDDGIVNNNNKQIGLLASGNPSSIGTTTTTTTTMQSQDKYLMTMSSLDCKLYVEKRDRDLNNTYRCTKQSERFFYKIVAGSELDSFSFPAFSIHCQVHRLLRETSKGHTTTQLRVSILSILRNALLTYVTTYAVKPECARAHIF